MKDEFINNTPPILRINNITVNSKDYSIHDRLKFDYTANSFSVDYIALSYKAPEKNLYQYRIKEIDTNWISTYNRNIQLSILSHGIYTIEKKLQ